MTENSRKYVEKIVDEKIIDENSKEFFNEKVSSIRETPVTYPPMNHYESIYDSSYVYYDPLYNCECYGDNYTNTDYQDWYRCHIIDNYQFMTRVFILRDPEAILIFEHIINSDEFFECVICLLDTYEPLKNLVKEIKPGFYLIVKILNRIYALCS